MPETVPSVYTTYELGGGHRGGRLSSDNVKLRFGEVKRVIRPKDPDSYSKQFYEYDVLVQQYDNGAAAHRLYHNCKVVNVFAGLADHTMATLRASDDQGVDLGNGSRVFILCVEGNDARAVIIGGPQQARDLSEGIHFESEFNGVCFQVHDDGAWTLTNKGKTDAKGNAHKDRDEGAGTTVKVKANGNFSVATPGNKCRVSVDHKAGTINIESSDEFVIKTAHAFVQAQSVDVKADSVNVDSPNVGLGPNAAEQAVKGNALASVLAQAFGVIQPTLPSMPQQAALAAATGQLATILSGSVKVGS